MFLRSNKQTNKQYIKQQQQQQQQQTGSTIDDRQIIRRSLTLHTRATLECIFCRKWKTPTKHETHASVYVVHMMCAHANTHTLMYYVIAVVYFL